MTLAERLSEYVRAAFSGLYVRSFEHDDAIAEIARLCRDQGWSLATWDVDRGLALGRYAWWPAVPGAADPLAAIRALPALATPEGTAILVLRNFHKFLGSPEVIQALDTQLAAGKQARTFVVILAPVVQVPVELEKQFVDRRARPAGARSARGRSPGAWPPSRANCPMGTGLAAVLDAAAGLTRVGGRERLQPGAGPPRAAGSRSALGDQGRDAQEVGAVDAPPRSRHVRRPGWAGGAQVVLHAGAPVGTAGGCSRQGGAPARATRLGQERLQQGPGRRDGSADLDPRHGGAARLAGGPERGEHAARRLRHGRRDDALRRHDRRGGEGPGRLVRRGSGDSGVSARLFGTLLTWLNDRTSDVRSWSARQRHREAAAGVWPQWKRLTPRFSSTCPVRGRRRRSGGCTARSTRSIPAQHQPEDRDWTPAEVKACCRLAALLDVSAGRGRRRTSCPVAATASEAIERLRTWAAGRCLAADRPGLYTRPHRAGHPTRPQRPPRPVGELKPTEIRLDSIRFAPFVPDPSIPDQGGGPGGPSLSPTFEELQDDNPARPARLAPDATASADDSPAPAQRLRATMAAVRVSFTWMGTQKTLDRDQKARAAETFGAEGQYLSAGKKLIDTGHTAFRAVTAIRGKVDAYWKGI